MGRGTLYTPFFHGSGDFSVLGRKSFVYASRPLHGFFFKKNIQNNYIIYLIRPSRSFYPLHVFSIGRLCFLEWDWAGRIRLQSLKMSIKKDPPAPPGGSPRERNSRVFYLGLRFLESVSSYVSSSIVKVICLPIVVMTTLSMC